MVVGSVSPIFALYVNQDLSSSPHLTSARDQFPWVLAQLFSATVAVLGEPGYEAWNSLALANNLTKLCSYNSAPIIWGPSRQSCGQLARPAIQAVSQASYSGS